MLLLTLAFAVLLVDVAVAPLLTVAFILLTLALLIELEEVDGFKLQFEGSKLGLIAGGVDEVTFNWQYLEMSNLFSTSFPTQINTL